MLKIEKIFIENFKSIKFAEVNFGDLTVITGVNSSGKSSLFQSILYIAQWYASAEFINNEDEFYIPHLAIYDRYLVNKNRSYEGLKNNIELPIKLGFKNQNQELKIQFSNQSYLDLRVNPEIITIQNTEMNRKVEIERFTKLTDFIESKDSEKDEIKHFLHKYFLGNLYFDLIGSSIRNDLNVVDNDLEPFSISSIFNYDLDEILEKRNLGNDKLKKFERVSSQLSSSQPTHFNNGILKLSDRNYGDSYLISNTKATNLFSKRYKQDFKTNSLVLKESNFFLEYFLSKLPLEITKSSSHGSGIREEEDFLDPTDILVQSWQRTSKIIIFQNLLKDLDIKNVSQNFESKIQVNSKFGDAINIFYLFQKFLYTVVSRSSVINPLELPNYIDDYIQNLEESKKRISDNIKNRRVFDAIDELEFIISDINKEFLKNQNSTYVALDKLNYEISKIPTWNSEMKSTSEAKSQIYAGREPYISVTEDVKTRKFNVVEGISAVKAYEQLGWKNIKVNVIDSNNYCICNNRAWEVDDRDIDSFLDKSKIENTKTYICPVDSGKIHLGYFSRGEDTESAHAQKYSTLYVYPKQTKNISNKDGDPIEFIFDLFVYIEKNQENFKLFKKFFSFLFEDNLNEIIDKEISILKNFVKQETEILGVDFKEISDIPDYGIQYKTSHKKSITYSYYDSTQDFDSIFNTKHIGEANFLIVELRKIKKKLNNNKLKSKHKASENKNIKKIFDLKVVLFEKRTMHNSLENVYPDPFSEKANFLNDLSYLSTIRDPDDQNDPVGNYSKLLPIGQNAGGLADYLTLYGDREVDPFIAPKFSPSGKPLREYDDLEWVQNDSTTLYEAIKLWLKYLGLKDFDFQVINEGTEKRIKFKGGVSPSEYGREITEIGSGIGKILPVIVNCLIAKKDQVVLIEEPETHLHPSAQTYLADFLFAMSVSRQIVIETHSPNIIDRLRFRNIHKSIKSIQDSQKPEIEIIFSELENNITKFRHGKIDDLGDIVFENSEDMRPWPTGFFDNTDRDLTNILQARKEIFDKNFDK